MPICPNCRANNPDGTAYCPNCGAPQNATPAWEVEPQKQDIPSFEAPVWEDSGANSKSTPVYTNPESSTLPTGSKVMGIVSLICGIVSIFSSCVGLLPGIAAIVLSALAKKNAGGMKNSQASVGLVTGIIGTVLGFIWAIAMMSQG